MIHRFAKITPNPSATKNSSGDDPLLLLDAAEEEAAADAVGEETGVLVLLGSVVTILILCS